MWEVDMAINLSQHVDMVFKLLWQADLLCPSCNWIVTTNILGNEHVDMVSELSYQPGNTGWQNDTCHDWSILPFDMSIHVAWTSWPFGRLVKWTIQPDLISIYIKSKSLFVCLWGGGVLTDRDLDVQSLERTWLNMQVYTDKLMDQFQPSTFPFHFQLLS